MLETALPAAPISKSTRGGRRIVFASESMDHHSEFMSRTLSKRVRRSPKLALCAVVFTLPALLGACTETTERSDSTTTSSAAAAPLDSQKLDADMAALESRYSTRIAVTAIDPTDGRSYRHRADERVAMCSTFKTYAVAALLRAVAAGTVSLDDKRTIEPGTVVVNSPVTSEAVGTQMTLAQLADAALTRSDNTAGNYLLDTIGGPAAITSFARSVGDDATRLDRREPELNEALRGDPRDTSTSDGLAAGYNAVLLGDALGSAERKQLVDWMRASQTSDKRMRAGLPAGWTAADKTGAGDYGTVTDAGVVWRPDGTPVVLVVLTDSLTDQADAAGNNQVIADATAAVLAQLG